MATDGAEAPLLSTIGLAVAPLIAALVAGMLFLFTLSLGTLVVAAACIAATAVGVSMLCGRMRPSRKMLSGQCCFRFRAKDCTRRLRIVRCPFCEEGNGVVVETVVLSGAVSVAPCAYSLPSSRILSSHPISPYLLRNVLGRSGGGAASTRASSAASSSALRKLGDAGDEDRPSPGHAVADGGASGWRCVGSPPVVVLALCACRCITRFHAHRRT